MNTLKKENMIVRQAHSMIKIYVISENSRQHKIEDMRVPTEIKTNEFLKLVIGRQLCPDVFYPRAVYSIW